jgi:beta-glucuronidase
MLNGKPLRLRGYNRHEDHPQFGCALPAEAMVTDLALLRDLGCNFVRTAHYPNDMRFLDLCDEMGVYVWEESHARNVEFKHPKFRQQIVDSTREMIEWHHNRPSVILWGCLNECESRTRSGRREYERVFQLMRSLDPSRPVTFASNRRDLDICLDLVDIVSWNRYDAWYGGEPENIEPAIRDILRWLHSPKSKGGRGKPVIMSECGAGAIYGCRHPNHAKWTEEYQAEVLDETLRVYLNHPDIVGVAIWQFCDCRVTRNRWSGRPRTMNNKGTVDEYRRPKLAYEVVKRRMHEAAD